MNVHTVASWGDDQLLAPREWNRPTQRSLQDWTVRNLLEHYALPSPYALSSSLHRDQGGSSGFSMVGDASDAGALCALPILSLPSHAYETCPADLKRIMLPGSPQSGVCRGMVGWVFERDRKVRSSSSLHLPLARRN